MSQRIRKSDDPISDEDFRIILNLLPEYSAKLVAKAKEVTNLRMRRATIRYIVIVLAMVVIFLSIVISLYSGLSTNPTLQLFIVGLAIGISLGLVIELRELTIRLPIYYEFVTSELENLSAKLESIAGAISQYSEHRYVGFALRLEIDLRLAEVEEALRLANFSISSSLYSSKSKKPD